MKYYILLLLVSGQFAIANENIDRSLPANAFAEAQGQLEIAERNLAELKASKNVPPNKIILLEKKVLEFGRIYEQRYKDLENCEGCFKNDPRGVFFHYKGEWIAANTVNFLKYKEECGLTLSTDMPTRKTWTDEKAETCDKIANRIWGKIKTGQEAVERLDALLRAAKKLEKIDSEYPYTTSMYSSSPVYTDRNAYTKLQGSSDENIEIHKKTGTRYNDY